jgi:hypothetical protein
MPPPAAPMMTTVPVSPRGRGRQQQNGKNYA